MRCTIQGRLQSLTNATVTLYGLAVPAAPENPGVGGSGWSRNFFFTGVAGVPPASSRCSRISSVRPGMGPVYSRRTPVVDASRSHPGPPPPVCIIQKKATKETEIMQNGYKCNTFLNSGLSYDKLEKIILKLKNNKAIGCDGIPNEVLCNYDVTITLFRFFSIVFESGIIPAEWKKWFISPIPKCSKKDPFLPLNYRGISLLSCVGKLYSSILD